MEIKDPIATLSEDLHHTGLRPNRRKGQNYLISPRVRRRIVDLAMLSSRDAVLEIGPGTGILTWALAECAGRVVSVELEKVMADLLSRRFAEWSHVNIIHGDGLVEMERLIASDLQPRFKLVSNLPYQITSPVLLSMCRSPGHFPEAVLLLQKELVERVAARPGDTERSALSVLVQSRYRATREFQVGATMFRPRPRVDSAVLSLVAVDRLGSIPWDLFSGIVFKCFGQRRKTIQNNLKSFLSTDTANALIHDIHIPSSARPQDLDLDVFLSISNRLSESGRKSWG
ncbi:MAG TPA: 16S rRNA (adenine(1518)-N(6)/adenine(1519)-N(6))-dimethyltransferase RsmA [bacterium]|nr:16S rRNA (adenine(1518)-N(6)/adenine(1519)-N(6))-dimethyltransferase RsmA [bacterium]